MDALVAGRMIILSARTASEDILLKQMVHASNVFQNVVAHVMRGTPVFA